MGHKHGVSVMLLLRHFTAHLIAASEGLWTSLTRPTHVCSQNSQGYHMQKTVSREGLWSYMWQCGAVRTSIWNSLPKEGKLCTFYHWQQFKTIISWVWGDNWHLRTGQTQIKHMQHWRYGCCSSNQRHKLWDNTWFLYRRRIEYIISWFVWIMNGLLLSI